jgi:hypothetical protein
MEAIQRRDGVMKKQTLSRGQVLDVIERGEFSPEVVGSNRRVAIIMTQDWCSQYVFDTLAAGRSWHPADQEMLKSVLPHHSHHQGNVRLPRLQQARRP